MAVYALGDAYPEIDPTAYVHPDATVIGDVVIGPEASIWPRAVLRGDEGKIRIGARTSIQDGSVIHTLEDYATIIGDDCVVGHLVHVEGATIDNRCLLGSGSTVLPGVELGTGSLVGAGAVVTPRTVAPPGSLLLGAPARLVDRPVEAEAIDIPVESYRNRAKRFARELEPIDYVPGVAVRRPDSDQAPS